jgi:hypothetical protein
MKTLRNLTFITAVTTLMVFCASGNRAFAVVPSFTTNYDALNITATVGTNIATHPTVDIYVYAVHKFTLNNAAILSMLEGHDWHNAAFPAGAKLVVSWDAGHNVYHGNAGDILVVDKTGTNVLYDASVVSWSVSGNASMTVNFFEEKGDYNEKINDGNPGYHDFTMFNNTEFEIYDDGTSYVEIYTTGPSTETSTQDWNKHGDFTSWTDSEQTTTSGADQSVDGYSGATITVKISASGHGPGVGGWYYAYNL